MKKIFIPMFAFLMLAIGAQAQTDAITKYFDKYVDDERFSMIYISPKMFDLVSRIELESEDVDPEVMDIVKDLKGLRILTFDGEGASGYFKEAKGIIDANNYEELMYVREGNENVYVVVNSSGDIVNELVLLVEDANDFVIMSFVGNIDLKKVGKLGSLLDIDHIEHLEDIKKY